MEKLIRLLGQTKQQLKEEREKVRNHEARFMKETDSLVL